MSLTQLEKYAKAIQLLTRTQGASKKELKEALGLKDRAIQDIINTLGSVFPIMEDSDGRSMIYYIDAGAVAAIPIFQDCTKYTAEDVALFSLLKEEMKYSPGLEKSLSRLLNKISLTVAATSENGMLSESQLARRKIVKEQVISKKIKDKQIYHNVINVLFDAINKNKWVSADYQGMYQEESYIRDIYPLVVISSKGDLYLYCLNYYEELRMYALENFLSATIIEEKAKPETKVDIDSLIYDPFGTILDSEEFIAEVWVDADQGFYEIQKSWPKSVSFEEKDGGYLFTIKTRSQYGLEEWILKHAESMKVISPEKVRNNVIERLKKALDLYND